MELVISEGMVTLLNQLLKQHSYIGNLFKTCLISPVTFFPTSGRGTSCCLAKYVHGQTETGILLEINVLLLY